MKVPVQKEFRYMTYDRRNKENRIPINRGSVYAHNKTDAREKIIWAAKVNCDVPSGRMARDCGFVPISDWKIEFYEERNSNLSIVWKWIGE